MNKLVIDPHGRNHFRFIPTVSLDDWPEDEKERLKKIEAIYKDLIKNGEIIFAASKRGSHSIKCVRLNNLSYIVICLRNNDYTVINGKKTIIYNNSIYEMASDKDALNICKFIAKNNEATMSDYKDLMEEASKKIAKEKIRIIRKEEQDETNTSKGDDQQATREES